MEKKELDQLIVKVWEKSIDTQVHFNDLIMRNRTIVVSFVTAVFGAAAYSLRESELCIQICGKEIHISALIILFGMAFLGAYAYLDINYYFRLLLGSVEFTEDMDKEYKGLGLTTKISERIRHEDAKRVLWNHYRILLAGAAIVFFLLLIFL